MSVVHVVAVLTIVGLTASGGLGSGALFGAAVTGNLNPSAPNGAALIAPSGLIAYWPIYDDGTGNLDNCRSSASESIYIQDSVGGIHMAAENGASCSTDVAPVKFPSLQSVYLNSGSHQYFGVSTLMYSAPKIWGTSFTISAWAKRNSTGHQYIVSCCQDGTDAGFAMGWLDNDQLLCGFVGDRAASYFVYPDTGSWHHYACSFDLGNKYIQIWRDGALVGAGYTSGVLKTPSWPGWTLGVSTWGVGYFNGHIDDLRVYNHALTPTDIAYLAGGNP